MSDAVTREFLLAFWKIHILYHAEEHGVYGHWMLEELHPVSYTHLTLPTNREV